MNRSMSIVTRALMATTLGLASAAGATESTDLPELGSSVPSTTVTAAAQDDALCTKCHDEYDGQVLSVYKTRHGVKADGRTPGCQSCHGSSVAHIKNSAKTSPRTAPDVVFGVKLKLKTASRPDAQNESCLACHDTMRTVQHWAGSGHEAADVTCAGCHRLHATNEHLLTADTEVETCLDCHRKQRANLRKRSTHPLFDASHADGSASMTCTSCHGPHGTVGEKLVDANTINDKCYECHQEKKAPVLWEHSIVKENCLACHNVHGSNHEMMLTAKSPRLCQQCHEQGRHQTVAGETNSFLVVNRGCSNCHSSIHGTNNPSGIKLKN